MPKPVYHIVAVAENGIIGRNGKLPWSIPPEWKYFIDSTAGGIMVMGRICAESFGVAFPDRQMIAVTSQPNVQIPGFLMAGSLEEALNAAQFSRWPGPVWICGGTRIYADTFACTERLYLTRVHLHPEGDTYYPGGWENTFTECLHHETHQDSGTRFTIQVLGRPSVSVPSRVV